MQERTATRIKGRNIRIVEKAGLNPNKWLLLFQDRHYLHLVDNSVEQRQGAIIDKDKKELVRAF